MEVHVVHAQSVGLVLLRLSYNDVLVKMDVEARTSLQQVPHLDGSLDGAVGDLRLGERGAERPTLALSTHWTLSITSMYRSPVAFILSTSVFTSMS